MPNSGASVTGRDGVWNVAVRVACRSGPVLCDERRRLSLACSGGGAKRVLVGLMANVEPEALKAPMIETPKATVDAWGGDWGGGIPIPSPDDSGFWGAS